MTIALKAKWRPDLSALEACREHGRKIAREWALSPLPASIPEPAPEKIAAPIAAAASVSREGLAMAESGECNWEKMICTVCQWVYDPAEGEPDQGVGQGTPWEEVPDDFLCPGCALGKSVFDTVAE